MLRCRPTPAPRPRLRAPIRWPCWARRSWPRSGWHRRALPDGPAVGGCHRPCCGSGRGRVGGKPGQHRSDRLGLLLRKEAASLTAQQLHLVGEPWWPRSWPSTTAAALAGGGSSGLACRWLGTRIGVGHVRLLARPSTAVGTAGRVPRPSSTAGGVSHPIPIVSRSRRSGRPRGRLRPRRRACRPDDDPAPRLHDEVALSVQRHGDPANPRMDRGRAAWLARIAQRNWAAHARRNRPAPARWRRIGSITRRSPTVHAVSGSFIRRSPATRWRRRG